MFFLWFTLLLSITTSASPTDTATTSHRLSYTQKHGTNYTVFTHAPTGATLEFVNNSGICETTPNVNQYSGYLSVGEGLNMFFWYPPFTPSLPFNVTFYLDTCDKEAQSDSFRW